MYLSKIYLDSYFRESLEQLSIREFIIEKYNYESSPQDNKIIHRHFTNKRVLDKTRLFQILTLFEKIDGDSTIYDFSKFVDEGIVDKNALMLSNDDPLKLAKESDINLVCNIETTSNEIISSNRRKIINYFINDIEYASEISEKYSFSYMDLLSKYNLFLDYLDDWQCSREVRDNYPEYILFFDYLVDLKTSLDTGLYFSLKDNSSFISRIKNIPNIKKENTINIIDDMEYIVKTNFTDELNILPYPENLADVFTMRKSKEITRFREVLSYWFQALEEGNPYLEKKIRKDIKKANSELKTLKKWKEYKDSQFSFWLNSIGGHIPMLSNVLTLISMIGGLSEDYIEDKNTWVMLTKK